MSISKISENKEYQQFATGDTIEYAAHTNINNEDIAPTPYNQYGETDTIEFTAHKEETSFPAKEIDTSLAQKVRTITDKT